MSTEETGSWNRTRCTGTWSYQSWWVAVPTGALGLDPDTAFFVALSDHCWWNAIFCDLNCCCRWNRNFWDSNPTSDISRRGHAGSHSSEVQSPAHLNQLRRRKGRKHPLQAGSGREPGSGRFWTLLIWVYDRRQWWLYHKIQNCNFKRF